jgi:DNA-binding response OmpR family regulator
MENRDMLVDCNEAGTHVAGNFIYQLDYQGYAASPAIRVLLLANDMMQDSYVAPSLLDDEWSVTRVVSVDTMIAAATTSEFDIVVVDLRPDLLGYQAVRRLRMAHLHLPVLFVSARSTKDAFDCAFAVGADDVVVLPLDRADLKKRLMSLVAGAGTSKRAPTINIGRLEIDLEGRYARVAGAPLALNSHEYAACELLASRNGAPVGKSAILDRAYDGAVAPNRNVDQLMSRLRSKLAQAGADNLIQTVAGLGYAMSSSQPVAARAI